MKEYGVSEVLSWTGGRLANEAELESGALNGVRIRQASVLSKSKPADIAFFFSPAFQSELPSANPGILITGEAFVKPLAASGLPLWKRAAVIACADPYLAMAKVTRKIANGVISVGHLPGERASATTQVHPTAVIDPEARIGAGASIGAHCVVERDAVIGEGAVLYPHVYVGVGAHVGAQTVIFPHVTLYELTQIGERVRLHSGVVLGADGFGYAPLKEKSLVTGHEKIFHFGRVVIGDDVEIGANTCIDRGTFGDTVVEKGVKIDNHVQIGHNCRIEEGAIICGAVGLAGSAHIGKFAYIGGLAGIGNQIHVGDRASVGACSLIGKDVPAGGLAVGNPQRSHREHFRLQATLNRMMAKESRSGSKSAEAARESGNDDGKSV